MSEVPSDPHIEEGTPAPPGAFRAQAPSVTADPTGRVLQPIVGESRTVEDFRAAFLAAFGTTELVIAEAFFEQLLNTLHADPGKPLDTATANLVLALLYRIRPNDEVEAMLACQMIAAHMATMDATRRALHAEQTAAGRVAYLSLARKLMMLFTEQMDALNRHRGKGTTQKIVIERVFVAPGAQAVVGAVASGGRGDGG
jgi:hypothetical protein